MFWVWKTCKKDFNKEWAEKFKNIYKFCNGDINKFISLLRKGVYAYEYLDSWKWFGKMPLPNKDASYS